MVLLQTGRRLASAAFRRESVCWSDDSFSSSAAAAAVAPVPSGKTSKSGSAFIIPAMESEAVSQLLAHVKLLLRRRAAAMAALDAGLPAEAVRHFSKILEARRGVLPHPFAAACLVGRAAAFQAGGRPADAIADCNRALAPSGADAPPWFLRTVLACGSGGLAVLLPWFCARCRVSWCRSLRGLLQARGPARFLASPRWGPAPGGASLGGSWRRQAGGRGLLVCGAPPAAPPVGGGTCLAASTGASCGAPPDGRRGLVSRPSWRRAGGGAVRRSGRGGGVVS